MLGCSKCRYSKRGCRRCKDSDFQARQLAKANANHPDADRIQKAVRKRGKGMVGKSEIELPPAGKRRRKRAHHNTALKSSVDEAVEPLAGSRGADSAEQPIRSTAKRRIGSGLELGLAAGLLSLPVTGAAEQQQQSLENRMLEQRGQMPPSSTGASLPTSTVPGSSSDVSCISTQATGAAVEESSRGQDARGATGREEGPEEQKRRQRNFMELLHSKIQQKHEQRQQDGATKEGPSLAAALAFGARRKKVWQRHSPSCYTGLPLLNAHLIWLSQQVNFPVGPV